MDFRDSRNRSRTYSRYTHRRSLKPYDGDDIGIKKVYAEMCPTESSELQQATAYGMHLGRPPRVSVKYIHVVCRHLSMVLPHWLSLNLLHSCKGSGHLGLHRAVCMCCAQVVPKLCLSCSEADLVHAQFCIKMSYDIRIATLLSWQGKQSPAALTNVTIG